MTTFTLTASGELTFPKEAETYWDEKGSKLLDAILAGEDAAVNTLGGDIYRTISNRLSLDYASWNNARKLSA